MKILTSNYGSIPHLSTSKLTQQADKKIEIGQEKILTEKARDWKDLIIVTEKIDGSNVGIYSGIEEIIPITRKGYRAESSPFKQHHLFSKYVKKMFPKVKRCLPGAWRIVGEWCAVAHGTMYDLSDFDPPFVAFDIFDERNQRLKYLDFIGWCAIMEVPTVPLLHIGQPITIKSAVKLLGDGHYGKPEKPEGVVYRVERDGEVDFLAKWVREDKEDGKYLHGDEIYNKGMEWLK